MNKKRLIVAFSGPSNSGKTTAIVKVSSILNDGGFKVCIIKHDPKDKAVFDREGKDSFKFSQTGADVAVVSPNKTTLFKKNLLLSETYKTRLYIINTFRLLLNRFKSSRYRKVSKVSFSTIADIFQKYVIRTFIFS